MTFVTFLYYLPDALVGIFAVVFLAGLSLLTWMANRKSRWLKEIDQLEKKFDASLKDAVWKMFAYLIFAAPVTILMLVGSSTMVTTHPSWYVPLLLLNVIVPIVIMGYFTLFPLMRLCFASAGLGAVTIDGYVKEHYPLNYYPAPHHHLCQQ
jgi:hypothetical protein